MKKFEDLRFVPHCNASLGFMTTSKLFFDNGYGVSVITGGYGDSENPYELAVLKGTEDKWDLNYETPITEDVIGYLTEDRVTELMEEVQELFSYSKDKGESVE